MAGRPTKLDDDMIEKANAYAFEYENFQDEVPTAAGLARMLGVAKSTVYLWAETDEGFSDALETIKSEQERVLVSKGLNSSFNSTITKLLLTNHGYSDKQQVTHSAGDDAPVFEIAMVKPNEG